MGNRNDNKESTKDIIIRWASIVGIVIFVIILIIAFTSSNSAAELGSVLMTLNAISS